MVNEFASKSKGLLQVIQQPFQYLAGEKH